MNKINQNQGSPGLTSVEVLVIDPNDEFDIENNGNTVQGVTLGVDAARPDSGDIIFVSGRSDDKNGPWKLKDDGSGFERCKLQENLRLGAEIGKGSVISVEGGESAGRSFKISSSHKKDYHQQRVSVIGDAAATFTVREVTPDAAVKTVRKAQAGTDVLWLSGALDGANKSFVIEDAMLTEAAIVVVTLDDNELNHDLSGNEGTGYVYDEATQTVTLYNAPQPGSNLTVTAYGIVSADPVTAGEYGFRNVSLDLSHLNSANSNVSIRITTTSGNNIDPGGLDSQDLAGVQTRLAELADPDQYDFYLDVDEENLAPAADASAVGSEANAIITFAWPVDPVFASGAAGTPIGIEFVDDVDGVIASANFQSL